MNQLDQTDDLDDLDEPDPEYFPKKEEDKKKDYCTTYFPVYVFYDKRKNLFFFTFDFEKSTPILYNPKVFGKIERNELILEKRRRESSFVQKLENLDERELAKSIANHFGHTFDFLYQNFHFFNNPSIDFFTFRQILENSMKNMIMSIYREKKENYKNKIIRIRRKMHFYLRTSYVSTIMNYYTDSRNNIKVEDLENLYVAKFVFPISFEKNKGKQENHNKRRKRKEYIDQTYVKTNKQTYFKLQKVTKILDGIDNIIEHELKEEEHPSFRKFSICHSGIEDDPFFDRVYWADFFRFVGKTINNKYIENSSYLFFSVGRGCSLVHHDDLMNFLDKKDILFIYSRPSDLKNEVYCYLLKDNTKLDSVITMASVLNIKRKNIRTLDAKVVRSLYNTILF